MGIASLWSTRAGIFGVGVQRNEAARELIALVDSYQPSVVFCAAMAERK